MPLTPGPPNDRSDLHNPVDSWGKVVTRDLSKRSEKEPRLSPGGR
jgi:hypothetical protein